METLKTLSEIALPDPRQQGWLIRNEETGEVRERTLAEHHTNISRIQVGSHVPEAIRDSFETAKNLLLYSWYVYRFITVAELHAYSTLETALRELFERPDDKRPPGMSLLLKRAIDQGRLRDEHFADFRRDPERPIITGNSFIDGMIHYHGASGLKSHVEILSTALPRLRNALAHGSSSIWPGGYATLAVAAAAIDALYQPSDQPSDLMTSALLDDTGTISN